MAQFYSIPESAENASDRPRKRTRRRGSRRTRSGAGDPDRNRIDTPALFDGGDRGRYRAPVVARTPGSGSRRSRRRTGCASAPGASATSAGAVGSRVPASSGLAGSCRSPPWRSASRNGRRRGAEGSDGRRSPAAGHPARVVLEAVWPRSPVFGLSARLLGREERRTKERGPPVRRRFRGARPGPGGPTHPSYGTPPIRPMEPRTEAGQSGATQHVGGRPVLDSLFAVLGRLGVPGVRPGTVVHADYVSLKHGRMRSGYSTPPGSPARPPSAGRYTRGCR